MAGPLDDEQIARFRADGFLVCQQFLDPSLHAALRGWVEEMSAWPETADRWEHYREITDHGPALARTENFLPYHDGLRGLLSDSVVSQAVSQLFGEPAAVFKEKINYKHAGGGGFAPHQDAVAYMYGSQHITCLVAVDANRVDNGCLWFAPGRHAEGLLPVNQQGCLSDEVAAELPWVAATTPAGGAVFFSSLAPHKSGPNRSDQPRRSLYVTYTKASEGDLRAAYYEDRRRMMSARNGAAEGGPPRISTIGHFQGRGI